MTPMINIVHGSASRALTNQITQHLTDAGVEFGCASVQTTKFNDGETRVEVMGNIRGSTVFVVQSTSAPTNDTLMELMLIVDALRRSAAAKIIAVVPYFGYARQDRRPTMERVPISARVVATMLEAVGVDHVMTIDLHATQIQGFFSIAVDNLTTTRLLSNHIRSVCGGNTPMIVSPDVGGVVRARQIAKALDAPLSIIDKRRPEAGKVEVMNVIGDVDGQTCVIVDDMIDTAGTLAKAAAALTANGAKNVFAYATHGVLSGAAVENIQSSTIDRVYVTNSIGGRPESDRIATISVAPMLAESIHRFIHGRSIIEMQ